MSFTQFDLDAALLRGITDLGFTEPTPIQRAALPDALAGRDVLAAAMTGSGKTAAFALPILKRLAARNDRGTRALILTPTRELAAQVHEHLASLGRHVRVTSAAVYGGVGFEPQARALRNGVNVVIATPGRLLDHLGQGTARLDGIEVLVLDEADRMLDMGFLPDVKRIMAKLPRQRQTMLFSATLPAPIVSLAREFMSDPVRIGVERKAAPATGVTQSLLPVPEKLKPALLLELLRRREVHTALVFTRTKHRANRLATFLQSAGISCDRIHGNRTQSQRQAALSGFKQGRLQVLVATDIAARGIDVQELPHVVNFDVPVQAEDYIHRVGRTARAQATGTAVTFASPDDREAVAAIERAVGRPLSRRTLDGFDYSAQPAGKLEVPIAQRIAAIKAERADARERARLKAARAGAPAAAPRGEGRGERGQTTRSASGRRGNARRQERGPGSGVRG
ncbi:MAG: DEAD/DEAH box helicase, partial [Acidobacteriota bacterium]